MQIASAFEAVPRVYSTNSSSARRQVGGRVDAFHSYMPDHVRGMTPRSGRFPYSLQILPTEHHSTRDPSQTIATKDLFRSGLAGRVLAPNVTTPKVLVSHYRIYHLDTSGNLMQLC